jgi:hypothetical protein
MSSAVSRFQNKPWAATYITIKMQTIPNLKAHHCTPHKNETIYCRHHQY